MGSLLCLNYYIHERFVRFMYWVYVNQEMCDGAVKVFHVTLTPGELK